MKIFKKIILLFLLVNIYIFILTRSYIPETIAVKGEQIRISDIQVIPVGEIVGIKLYTSGVMVVGTSAIESANNYMYKPFENTEIQEGDSIIEINNKKGEKNEIKRKFKSRS